MRGALPPPMQLYCGYAAPITTEYWDDDSSPEFAQMMAQLLDEGTVLEQ